MKAICKFFLIISACSFWFGSASALTLSGPISADGVSISGGISVSSVTISTLTVSNQLSAASAQVNMKGLILQTVLSSTTVSRQTTSSTFTAVPGLAATVALSSPNNYFRISLSGTLQTEVSTTTARLSIERDTTNLSSDGFVVAADYPGIVSAGIVITDSPGDTSSHTYRPIFCNDSGSANAIFTTFPAAYLIVEEVSR